MAGVTKGKKWYLLIFENNSKKLKNGDVEDLGGGSKLVDKKTYDMCKIGKNYIDKSRAK